MINIKDIIEKKRKKRELTEEEIEFFISSYFKNEITDAQAAALITAIQISGLSKKEMTYMINAIAETGDELEISKLSESLTDIHPLGGMSDKLILMVMCVLDSLGVTSAKVIGRELGMEDRLKSIKNYKLEDNIDKFKNNISKNNTAILKEIKNIAPVENKLYKLRYHIACDNNIELVAISIMSQKIALGFKNIFFEITYGENAYVKTLTDAKLLAKYLINIGKDMNKNVGCCITSFEEPAGSTYGNILEMQEIYNSFSGKMAPDVEEVIIKFTHNILKTSKICKNFKENKRLIKDVISNGLALKSFEKLINSQGGDLEQIKSENIAKNVIPVISTENGYISKIDISKIRMLGKYLEAIRTKEDDKIDIGAGIVFNKKIGDKIANGETLAYVYTNNDAKTESAVIKAKEAFKISNKKIIKLDKVTYEI